MSKNTVVQRRNPGADEDLLSTMLREGAQRLVAHAVKAELEQFLFAFTADEDGRLPVVRNGFQPQRQILTGLGPVNVCIPKVRSRTEASAVFHSQLVPPYVRRAKSLDMALPWLYLHGVSTGDMKETLSALLGKDAAGLSAPVVARLKRRWNEEYKLWSRSSLRKEHWVYLWADGIYSGLRAEDDLRSQSASSRGYPSKHSARATNWCLILLFCLYLVMRYSLPQPKLPSA